MAGCPRSRLRGGHGAIRAKHEPLSTAAGRTAAIQLEPLLHDVPDLRAVTHVQDHMLHCVPGCPRAAHLLPAGNQLLDRGLCLGY